MSVAIAPVAQDKITATWPWVRDGLLEVIRRGKERWIPEDVYAALRNASAHLYTIQRDSEEVGFLVLQKLVGMDGVTLFVWAGWAQPMALMECRNEFFNEFDALARGIGAKRIRHNSMRDGWIWNDYFKVAHKVFEREV